LNENLKETSKVRITQTTLRRIIKEELDAVLDESMQKMLGLPHQYTTQDLMRAVKGLIDSPRGDMTPGSREARDVETLLSNHIRDKGTPEEKEALKKLRDDFLKSIGSVYRGGISSAHAGQTRYEKSRQRRAHFRDAMNEEDEEVARARKAKHIGPAFDVAQNKFQLDPEYQKGAKAMRDRVAKLKGKMNEDEDAEDAAEDAAYDNLESCVRAVIKDLLAAGVGADEASNIVFAAVRSTVYRAL
jgi:hypothetical protein